MVETKSIIFKGGGGSWKYEKKENGTIWIQRNTLIFKNRFLYNLIGRLVKMMLIYDTRKAMRAVKEILERKLID